MTREDMRSKLDQKDISGIGVKAYYTEGSQAYFFYEDFDGPGTGMRRAAQQFAHEVRRGTVKNFSFIELQNGVEVEAEPVGVIEYSDGDCQVFHNSEQYIQAFREALDQFGVAGGFKATTLTKDAESRKAVGDLIYRAFDEENPHDLEHYYKKYAPAAGEDQAQEAEVTAPELEEEDLEL